MTTDRSEQSGPEVVARQAKMSNGISVTKWGDWPLDKEQEPMIGRWSCEYRDLITLASHQQAVEALRAEVELFRLKVKRDHRWITDLLAENKIATDRAESAEARLARVAAVLADLRGRLTPSADFLADQIAAAIAPQDDTPPAARRGEE